MRGNCSTSTLDTFKSTANLWASVFINFAIVFKRNLIHISAYSPVYGLKGSSLSPLYNNGNNILEIQKMRNYLLIVMGYQFPPDTLTYVVMGNIHYYALSTFFITNII